MGKHLFPYKWYLKDGYPAKGMTKHNKKVFGTFICGGGSSMGYKLAGYEHLGGVEIDPKVADVYKANHDPRYLYVEDIREFNKRTELPKELYNLDLLDGSPPCSSFSMAGNREKDWGKKKVFREGQELQRLDDLVFEYVKTIDKLQPKVAILENVKGLIQGNAKAYAKKIKKEFEAAGYRVQLFLLNAASMGVPQKRERVFFIGLRNDIKLPLLKLEFREKGIVFGDVKSDFSTKASSKDLLADTGGFVQKVIPSKIHNTILGSTRYIYIDNTITKGIDFNLVGSYPLDYDFKNIKIQYLIGMSVPPIMTAQISNQIYKQWLSKV